MRKYLCILALAMLPAHAVSVLTARNSNSRNAANTEERILTPANIQAGEFGKLGSYAVDGFVYAQPLIAENVTIAGAPKTLLIIATMHNSVYAFDAERPSAPPVWTINFGPTLTNYPGVTIGPLLYTREVGCLSTPVIDLAANRLYAVCSGSPAAWILRKLDLSTGAVLASVTIAGQVPGTGEAGDTAIAGNLQFNPVQQLQRPALTLANSNVYIPFGSYADLHPYHGWIFAYDQNTLTQTGIVCLSPNSEGGSVWSSGGLAADAAGNLYATTGDGHYDGVREFGESIVKLSPTLAILDWFAPSNWATLDANDSDLSTSVPMLIPGSSYLVMGSKDYRIYSVDTANMGHLQGTGANTQQLFFTNPAGAVTDHSGIYGGMLLNGRAYFPNTAGKIYAFSFSGSVFNTTPTTSVATYEMPGAQMSGSSNGASNGIVWATTASVNAMYSAQFGTLRAFDPVTLGELWNSNTRVSDALGTLSKFAVPTIANGKVYVATQDGAVVVYGLRSAAVVRGSSALRGNTVIR